MNQNIEQSYYAYFGHSDTSGESGDTIEEAIGNLRETLRQDKDGIITNFTNGIVVRESLNNWQKEVLDTDIDNGIIFVTSWKTMTPKDFSGYVDIEDMLENIDDNMMCNDWQQDGDEWLFSSIKLSDQQKKELKDVGLYLAEKIMNICDVKSHLIPVWDQPRTYKLNGELVEDPNTKESNA